MVPVLDAIEPKLCWKGQVLGKGSAPVVGDFGWGDFVAGCVPRFGDDEFPM